MEAILKSYAGFPLCKKNFAVEIFAVEIFRPISFEIVNFKVSGQAELISRMHLTIQAKSSEIFPRRNISLT